MYWGMYLGLVIKTTVSNHKAGLISCTSLHMIITSNTIQAKDLNKTQFNQTNAHDQCT